MAGLPKNGNPGPAEASDAADATNAADAADIADAAGCCEPRVFAALRLRVLPRVFAEKWAL